MNLFSGWWDRIGLQLRLLILIQGCLAVILVAAQLWLTNQFEHEILSAAEGRATAIADGVINGLNTMMVNGNAGDKDSRAVFIEKMGASDKVMELRIVSSTATTRQYGPGLPAEEAVDELDRSVLAKGIPAHQLVRGKDGIEGLRTVLPFIAKKSFRTIDCLSCHKVEEDTVLGLASIVINIDDDLGKIEKISLWFWLGQGALQLVLYFVIGFIVRRLVFQLGGEPAYVIDIVRKIAKGNLSQNIVTQIGDTTSLLAAVKQMQEERRQAEDETDRKRVLLADIISFLPDATLAIDKEKRITIWNKAIEKMTGVPAAEMLGKGDHAYTVPFYGEARSQLMDLIFLDSSEVASRYPTITREGESLSVEVFCNALYNNQGAWVFVKASPLHDHSGEVIGAIEIVRDITERKQQEEKSRRLMLEMETILRNALVGIVYLKQRKIISCNRRLEEIFGYDPGELIGETTEKLYDTHETFVGVGERAYIHLGENNSYGEELMLKKKDGSLFYGALNGCAIDPAQPHEGSIWIYSDISERRRAELALRESRERFDLAVRGSSDGIWDWNIETGETYVSERWCEMLGYRPDEISFGPRGWTDWIHPEDRAAAIAQMREHFKTKKPYASEYRMPNKNGEYRWFLNRGQAIWNAEGRAVRVAGSTSDITERKQAELELRIAATIFEAQEGMIITNAANVILKVNRAFSEITGYSAEDAVGRTPLLLNSGRHDQAFYDAMWASIVRGGSWQGEIWNRRKSGEIYPEWLTITAVKAEDGTPTHYVGTFADITLRKAAEDEIKHLAFYDPLTRLPNRRLLLDRLHQALATSARRGRQGALLFIDLDNFKTLNDTLGHDKGDILLQQVAKRLSTCVREGDTVARLGGDEFVVMLEDLSDKHREAYTQAEMVGEKILATLNHTYRLAGHEHHSTPSIGVTLFSAHQNSVEELLKHADLAMYQAKAAGRNTLRFFDPDMQVEVSSRASLETDLRQGVAKGQFLLYYQAQVDDGGRLTGAEALLRWQHPQRGLVSPDDFIPLAEETGLILPLGHWVLETACARLVSWATQQDTALLTLAVNVSPRQFRHADFVDQVLAILDNSGADPRRLKLELTESLLLDDVEDVIIKMTALKARGVGFSLDDFGTGYSSLSYLKRLPLDQLKIDRSFVRDVFTDINDAAIAQAIIAMGQAMGLAVTAEGVETEDQRNFLSRLGCKAYQGFLFSRPLPLEEFEAFVKRP